MVSNNPIVKGVFVIDPWVLPISADFTEGKVKIQNKDASFFFMNSIGFLNNEPGHKDWFTKIRDST